MIVTLRIAMRNLIAARVRTSLLTAAISIVTFALVVLLALAHGIESALVESATALSAGHVNVAGWYKDTPTDAGPLLADADEVRAFVEAEVPGLEYTVARVRGWGKIISDAGSLNSGLSGIEFADESRFADQLEMAVESAYHDGGSDDAVGNFADLSKPGALLLFADHARRLGVQVGDQVAVQVEMQGGATNIEDYTVVAVARDMGMMSGWTAFVGRDDLLSLYGLNDTTTGVLMVYLDDIDRSEEVRQLLVTKLTEAGYRVMDHQPLAFFMKFETVAGEDWTGQKLDLTIWSDEVSFLTWVITAFNSVSWLVVMVLVAVIAAGIMNALWNAVRDRTREIGTMRAIGLSRSGVLMLILAEAAMLGLFATSLGALTGALAAMALDAAAIPIDIDAVRLILLSDTVRLVVRPFDLILAVLLLSLITAVSAILPAVRAATLEPSNAMRHAE